MSAPREQIERRIYELQHQGHPLAPAQEAELAELKAALRTPPHKQAQTRSPRAETRGGR